VPRFTVIIPTYNWSSVLPFSIGSVLRQTLADFELLVIGDGCTDDSAAVVAGINDPRLRWINLPANSGHQSGPNNEGLRQARGQFIAYLGHDDLWFPHHLARMAEGFETGAHVCYGVTELVPPGGGPPRPAPFALAEYVPGNWMPPSGVAHRLEAVQRVGGWPDLRGLPDDPESILWRRMHGAGCRFHFVRSLTAVKFPAAWRRDVYKLRPTHEQSAWSQRMQSESDMEVTELLKMLSAAVQVPAEQKSLRQLIREFRRELIDRARGRWSGKSRTKKAITREQFQDDRREFKGLDRRFATGAASPSPIATPAPRN